MVSKHVVMVIKQQNRFLVVKDSGWGCYLFPHFKTECDENARTVWQHLYNKFGEFSARYIYAFSENVTKNNVPEGKAKHYKHLYYLVDVRAINTMLEQERFIVNNEEYRWMTFEEMKADESTWSYNSEVIMSVERYCKEVYNE